MAIPGRCTGKSTQVDHVIDAEDGGSDEDENLRGACEPCHLYKSSVNSQRRSMKAREPWKTDPRPHPGVLPD